MSEQKRKIFLLSPEFPSYGISGSRGSGKSVLLEFIEEWFFKHNYITLDWFGSIDHENAYWCIADTFQIGQWDKLDTDDASKLIEYLKKWSAGIAEETNFQVARENERTIRCWSDNLNFKIKLDETLHHGYLYFEPDSIMDRKYSVIAFKNEKGERVLYGRNPARPDKEKIRLVGYPVLIILPKTTVLKQKNELCVCGIPLFEHDSELPCKKPVPLIKTVTDDMPLREIIELAAKEKRVCVFNRGFYGDQRDAYRQLAKMLKELPFLILRGSLPKHQCFCLGFREAGQIAPSGLKGMRGDYETNVKRELQTYIREARHLRTVLVLDFQRSSDIAKSIASQRDFLLIKRSTKDLLPDDLLPLWDNIEARRWQAIENLEHLDGGLDSYPSISRLKHTEVYALFPDRTYEKRTHGLYSCKHKRPSDSWASDANVEIQYLDKKELEKSVEEKTIKQLTQKREKKEQRIEALKAAKVMKEEGLTMEQIAVKIGWLGRDGKPSASGLQRALFRAIEDGLV